MNQHFQFKGDECLLSPAATLVVIADAIRSLDAGEDGKARARRVVDAVMAAARVAKFEQADILETMLLRGAEAPRLLAMCDALVQRLGAWAVLDIVRAGMGAVRRGDAA